MPFKSDAQKKFLFAQKPDVAKKFLMHSNPKAKLPKKAKKNGKR